MEYQTIKIRRGTYKKLRLLTAHKQTTMIELIDRLVTKGMKKIEEGMSKPQELNDHMGPRP